MSLKKQLVSEMKEAMKAGNKTKLGVVRYLRSQIKNYEIDHGEQDQAGLQQVIAKQVKQVKESIEEYTKADRDDLIEAEKKKLEIMKQYLPEQLSKEKLREVIESVLADSDQTQPGPVIGQVMSQVKNKADGNQVAALVREMID